MLDKSEMSLRVNILTAQHTQMEELLEWVKKEGFSQFSCFHDEAVWTVSVPLSESQQQTYSWLYEAV